MLENIDNDLKKNILKFFIIILSCFSIYAFTSSYFYEKQTKEMLISIDKKIGDFKMLAFHGPEPFTVDMIDLSNNTEIKDVFISSNCPLYIKNQPGMIVTMLKVVNVKGATGEKIETYEEGYEALCTNRKPKELKERK